MRVKVFDYGDSMMDRYSVLITDDDETYAWGMSANPNEICMSFVDYQENALGKRVSIKSLPVTVKNKIKELKAIIIAERKEV